MHIRKHKQHRLQRLHHSKTAKTGRFQRPPAFRRRQSRRSGTRPILPNPSRSLRPNSIEVQFENNRLQQVRSTQTEREWLDLMVFSGGG